MVALERLFNTPKDQTDLLIERKKLKLVIVVFTEIKKKSISEDEIDNDYRILWSGVPK